MLPSNLFLLYCKALPVHCQEIVTFNQKYSPRPGLTFTNGTCTIKVSPKKGLFYNFILQTLGRGQTAAPLSTHQRGPHFCCKRPCVPAPPTTAEQQGRTPAGPAGPLSPATRGAPQKGAQSGWNRGAFKRFIPHFLVWDEAFFLLSLRLLQSGKEVFLYDQSGSERQREGI